MRFQNCNLCFKERILHQCVNVSVSWTFCSPWRSDSIYRYTLFAKHFVFCKVGLFFFPLKIAIFCLEGLYAFHNLYICFQTHSELQILHKNLSEEKNRVVFATKVPLFNGLQVHFLFFFSFISVVLTGNVQLIKIKHVGRGYVSDEILWMKGKHSYSLLQTDLHRNFFVWFGILIRWRM